MRKKGRKVVQSKKTILDGIKFQSGLECTMYKLLKEAKIKHTYEGKSYVTLDECFYNGECFERKTKRSKEMVKSNRVRNVSYTPDFIGENEEWFIEVKGRPNESFAIRWKLFKNMLLKKGKKPLIFKPTNKSDCEQVIQILKQKGYGH